MGTKPTHEQAQLHLQVYDLRREARLRQARDWFQQNYRAETMEEAMKIAPMGTEAGINVGMVIGYWEQACALLNYGLLNEDLFFETSGEFFLCLGTAETGDRTVSGGVQGPEHAEKPRNRSPEV
jgi:hypothetical protein